MSAARHISTADLFYIEEGDKAILRENSFIKGQHTDFVGKPTGEKIEVKWYNYSLSPEFQKLIISQQYAVSGMYEIGEVTNLKLSGQTAATANFTWKVVLNEIGHISFGDIKCNCSGPYF